jgi:hypothetical protein
MPFLRKNTPCCHMVRKNEYRVFQIHIPRWSLPEGNYTLLQEKGWSWTSDSRGTTVKMKHTYVQGYFMGHRKTDATG